MSTPAIDILTAENAFFRCSSDSKLFAVRRDIPTDAALEMAASFLSAARSLAYSVAGRNDDEEVFALAYLIEMANGVVDASIAGLPGKGGAA